MSYEKQGTAHDPHAAGFALQGRAKPPALPAVDGGEIVERLLEPCRDYTGEMIVRHSTPRYEVHCEVLYDAATLITTQQQEIERLTKERDEWQDRANRQQVRASAAESRVQSLEEEVKVLREALKPFALAPDEWTVETVNAARAALKENGQ
ncbi:hypothetical protein VW35_02485 [Devosia soli]|uniref:Uncharacterized protein n=1 Tax=Devosia soli TaxID=361041 RepID=A0A0F5LFU6_9HYPH|nr:hypothetical protein [Devosia soli]KKB81054.1 hypothetical protein VW35_02485 [Devosia soli]